jgi:VTC domain
VRRASWIRSASSSSTNRRSCAGAWIPSTWCLTSSPGDSAKPRECVRRARDRGRRRFTYESVYFDTPDLRCFHDHVDGERPRYKIRSRYYRETDACFFEIKVKLSGDETIKRQRPYDHDDHGTITPEARAFIQDTLAELAGEEHAGDLAPSLVTSYQRLTLAAREGGERATLDLAVELRAMDGRDVELRNGVVLVETKTGEGGGRLDDELRTAGCEPMSISKYRLGIGLLLAEDPDSASVESLRSCFVVA